MTQSDENFKIRRRERKNPFQTRWKKFLLIDNDTVLQIDDDNKVVHKMETVVLVLRM